MKRDGLTIIEVLIALTLLSVGVLALAGTLVGTSSMRRLSSSRLELVNLSESKLEELRMIAANPAAADTMQLTLGGSLTASVPFHADTVSSTSGALMIRRWTVAAAPAGLLDVVIETQPRVQTTYHVRAIRLASRLLR